MKNKININDTSRIQSIGHTPQITIVHKVSNTVAAQLHSSIVGRQYPDTLIKP